MMPVLGALAALARLRDERAMIIDKIEDANDELGLHRANVAATKLNPDATPAVPHLGRRSLQMVLRLDAYLADPDEVRAITRHMLHQPGTITYSRHTITYSRHTITVTIDRPDQPRIARALHQLTQELNTNPARIPATPGRSPTK